MLEGINAGSVIYGLQAIIEGFRYVFGRIEHGWMMLN